MIFLTFGFVMISSTNITSIYIKLILMNLIADILYIMMQEVHVLRNIQLLIYYYYNINYKLTKFHNILINSIAECHSQNKLVDLNYKYIYIYYYKYLCIRVMYTYMRDIMIVQKRFRLGYAYFKGIILQSSTKIEILKINLVIKSILLWNDLFNMK